MECHQSAGREAVTHHVHVGGERSQVVVRQLVDYVSCAKDVLDLPGLKKCLEFFGEVRLAVRDVQVADDEDEHLNAG